MQDQINRRLYLYKHMMGEEDMLKTWKYEHEKQLLKKRSIVVSWKQRILYDLLKTKCIWKYDTI